MRFEHPYALILLAIPPLLVLLERRVAGSLPALPYPSLAVWVDRRLSWAVRLAQQLAWLRVAGLMLLVLALARPQGEARRLEIPGEAVDVMVILDVSNSMKARDVGGGSRFEVAREVVGAFIGGRPHDRIGIVVFAGEAMTLCPATGDHAALRRLLERAHPGMLTDGTAIGTALATTVNRLADAPGAGRIAILITDGINNRGQVTPDAAARLARARGIRVYTVGVGAEPPATAPRGSGIDEVVLRRIAAETTGTAENYRRARNADALRAVFGALDRELPATHVEARYVYHEYFGWFAIPAGALLLLEVTLRRTRLRVLPR
ncbi:MAG: VWA domain-containing protein [Candidatus Schekmanbacteria bacterium]|nr:VWA domain-containing protein [Candidatus Schekmanbacteria bacterium]